MLLPGAVAASGAVVEIVGGVEIITLIAEDKIIQILLHKIIHPSLYNNKAKSLIKGAPRPVRMFQLTRAPGTGRKVVLRPIVVTLLSVAGLKMSCQEPLVPEKLASLIKYT